MASLPLQTFLSKQKRSNIVFLEASTGHIGAVKASVMFARAILHVPFYGKARPDTVVKSRLRRWAQGNYQSLLDDLAEYEVAFQRRQPFRSDADERDKRVERKLADGEISKALQAAMPSGPYNGPIDMLRSLHPPKPPGITLLDLPDNIPIPTVEPIEFYRALCETSRGTAQTATGWASDHMKDINVCPCNDEEDPLYGFRAFTIAFATGTLPVSQEVFTYLVSSKLVALKKPDSDKPRPVGVTGGVSSPWPVRFAQGTQGVFSCLFWEQGGVRYRHHGVLPAPSLGFQIGC